SANFDCKLIIKFGYELELLFANLNGSLNARNGNRREASKMCDEMLLRNINNLMLLVLKVLVLIEFNLLVSLSEIAFTLFI
ncbi:hypothetical protein MKW98_022236, partial [Papaver atlanticum]